VVPGHNPLGALSVLALLGLLLAQVTLGLFCVDVDGLESGPLSNWVTFETGRECSRLHQLGFDVLKVFIVLHLAAVVFYWLFKRDNLIRPMITGRRISSSRHGGTGCSALRWRPCSCGTSFKGDSNVQQVFGRRLGRRIADTDFGGAGRAVRDSYGKPRHRC
jgi:hypothetical protein